MRFSLVLLQPRSAVGRVPPFHAIVSCLRRSSACAQAGLCGMQVAPPRGRPYVLASHPAPRRPIPMTNLSIRLRLASTTLAVATILCGGFSIVPAAAQAPADELVAHRAVYELKLANTRG